MKIHKSITMEKLICAVKDEMFGTSNPGFCIVCGNQQDECEPDARNYECDECGRNQVFGAAELLMTLV